MKPSLILLIVIVILAACQTNLPGDKTGVEINDSNSKLPVTSDNNDTNSIQQPAASEKATFFIVIADTSPNYYFLQDKMLQLNKILHLPIDTMGRYYNKAKNLIALPDSDEDAMYAGKYFQRRFPSESLSMEYLYFYMQNAGEKTIALMSGIYESQTKADSALAIVRQKENKSFVIKADIYLGDIH